EDVGRDVGRFAWTNSPQGRPVRTRSLDWAIRSLDRADLLLALLRVLRTGGSYGYLRATVLAQPGVLLGGSMWRIPQIGGQWRRSRRASSMSPAWSRPAGRKRSSPGRTRATG